MNAPTFKRDRLHFLGFHGKCAPQVCEKAAKLANEAMYRVIAEDQSVRKLREWNTTENYIVNGFHEDEFGVFPCLGADSCVVCLSEIEPEVMARIEEQMRSMLKKPGQTIILGTTPGNAYVMKETVQEAFDRDWERQQLAYRPWLIPDRSEIEGNWYDTEVIGDPEFVNLLAPEAPRAEAPEGDFPNDGQIHQNESTRIEEGE